MRVRVNAVVIGLQSHLSRAPPSCSGDRRRQLASTWVISGQLSVAQTLHCARCTTIMAALDHLSDEIESILYIAREVMGECRLDALI